MTGRIAAVRRLTMYKDMPVPFLKHARMVVLGQWAGTFRLRFLTVQHIFRLVIQTVSHRRERKHEL